MMLTSKSRLKQNLSKCMSYIKTHRRIIFFVFFILPVISYIIAWMLSTTETFFPRPLRQAKEVLIVVAHPDDECMSSELRELMPALFFAPSVLRTMRSGDGQGNMLVLSAGKNHSKE